MWRRRHCCVGATLRRRFDELVTLSLRHVPTGHAVLPKIPTMSTTDIKGNAEFPLICSLGVPAILIENVLTPSFFMVVYTNMNKIFSCDQAALQMVFSVCLSVCPSVCLSVCPSVRLSHLFDYVPIIVSSWNFEELLPMTKVRSMQTVKVRGQRWRSQRSQPNLTVSGL